MLVPSPCPVPEALFPGFFLPRVLCIACKLYVIIIFQMSQSPYAGNSQLLSSTGSQYSMRWPAPFGVFASPPWPMSPSEGSCGTSFLADIAVGRNANMPSSDAGMQ